MQHLLQQYDQLRSTDLNQVQQHIAHILCPHQLHLNNNQSLNTELYYRASSGLGFGRLRYGAHVSITPEPLLGFYLLQIPIQGYEQIQLGKQRFESHQHCASMINPNDEFSMEHSQEANKLFIRICKTRLEQFYVQHYQRPLRGELHFSVLHTLDTPAGQSIWHLMQWLFQESSQGLLFDEPASAQRLENFFLAHLLDLCAHNQSPESLHSTCITPHTIKQAKAFIDEHLDQPLTVQRIANTVGISTRSLYAGFKEYVGYSPMQFVKQRRLELARSLLAQADPTQQTVTQLALQCGFTHLGLFARDYQQRYGERPSATLLR